MYSNQYIYKNCVIKNNGAFIVADKNLRDKLIPKELLKADTDQQNVQSFKTRENNIKNAIFKEVKDHKSLELSLESKSTNDHASVSNAESVLDTSIGSEDGFEETDAAGIVHGTYISTKKNGNIYEIGYKASPKLGFVVTSSNLEAETAIPIMESSMPDINEKSFEETDPDGTVHGLFSFKDPEGIVYTVHYEASNEKGFLINNITKQELQVPLQAEERLKKVSPIDNILNKASDKTSTYTKNKITDSLSTSANNRIYSVSADGSSEDKWGKIGETNGLPSSVIIQSPILKRSLPEPDTWKSDKTIDETSVTEDPETKPQPNSAYRFGFSADCQTRNEEADSNGNVRGSYSYIDGDGLETRVKYEAGPEKGFVIKDITYNSMPNNIDQSKTTAKTTDIPNNGESHIIDKDYNKVLQKVQKDNLPVNDKNKNVKRMPIHFKRENNGFSASGTHSSSEQILQNPLDYKKTPNRASKRNSDGFFEYSYETPGFKNSYTDQPKNIIHDRKRGNGEYKQLKRTSNRDKTLHRPDVLSSKYLPQDSVYDKNPSFKMENYNNQMYNNINPLNGQTQSYDGIGLLLMNMAYNQQTTQNEKRADQSNILNTANKQQIFEDIPFEMYDMPSSDKIPVEAPKAPEVEIDPSAIKRAVAISEIESQKIKQGNNQKQFGIGPLNGIAQENFSRMSPDGSYAFSYTTNDHSRHQSVDPSGNVYSIYQYQSKNDGKNVLVLQTNSLNYPKKSLLGDFKPLPYRSRTQNIQSPTENPTLSYKEPSSSTFNQRRRAESSPIAVRGQRGSSRSNRGGNKKTTDITPGGILAEYSLNSPLTEKPFRGNTKYIQAGFY